MDSSTIVISIKCWRCLSCPKPLEPFLILILRHLPTDELLLISIVMDARLGLALPVLVHYSNEPFSAIVDQPFPAGRFVLEVESFASRKEEWKRERVGYPENPSLKLFAQS